MKNRIEYQVTDIRFERSKKMYDEEEKRISFGRTLNTFLLTFHSLTFLFVITWSWNISENQSDFVANSGVFLSDYRWLLVQIIFLVLG